jgi:inorganic pyrophosphatase
LAPRRSQAVTEPAPPLSRLPTYGVDGAVHVVIETPKGSPNKYAYSEAFHAFQFKMVLPEGMSFPYDFGMIPSTKGMCLIQENLRE